VSNENLVDLTKIEILASRLLLPEERNPASDGAMKVKKKSGTYRLGKLLDLT
jgi:hypothetical protein